MAFRENIQDNFKPSSSPWGDDNVTIYEKTPFRKQNNISMSSDGELKDLMIELTKTIRQTPPCKERVEMAERLKVIIAELKRRGKTSPLENPVKETMRVVEDKYNPEKYREDCGEEEEIKVTDRPSPIEEIEELEGEIEEEIEDNKILGMDFNNFLIGALIVITFISVTRK